MLALLKTGSHVQVNLGLMEQTWRHHWEKGYDNYYDLHDGDSLFNNGIVPYISRNRDMGNSCDTFMQNVARPFISR